MRRSSSHPTTTKIKFNFDIALLDVLVKYTRCEYVRREDLIELKQFFDYIDAEMYSKELPIYFRIRTLQSILKSMIDLGLHDTDLIRCQLKTDFETGLEIIDSIGFERNQLNTSECDHVKDGIHIRVQHITVYEKKDRIISLLRKIDDTADVNPSYYETFTELKQLFGELATALNNNNEVQGLLKEFSFSDPNAANLLTRIVTKMKKPTAILQSGIRQLNALLSPGFKAGDLHIVVGGSNKFKSGTLLNIADQIRLFNPQIIPYENGLRKCILYLTMEDSIEKTLIRYFDMYSDMDADFLKSTPEEVIRTFREDGEFSFTNSAGIDIVFKYYGMLSISTADIYGIYSDLINRGYQPICIIQDYMERINSAHDCNGDERLRVGFVGKELKVIAQFFEIPVITAMQLNREGNSIIDAAVRDNKQDVARFVGATTIGVNWDIFKDADWICLVNLELQKSTQKLFLTFKCLKHKDKLGIGAIEYFNHPFANQKNIRLASDVNLSTPLSIISLANDLESVRDEEEESNAPKLINLQQRARERKSSTSIIRELRGTIAPQELAA